MAKNKTILLLILIVFCFASCNTTKRIARKQNEVQTTHVEQTTDSTRTEVKNELKQITDTTKTKQNELSVIEGEQTQTKTMPDGTTTTTTTTFKKTTTYFSEEDKFYIEHGFTTDSIEIKNINSVLADSTSATNTEEKATIKRKERASRIFSIILLLMLAVCGYIGYRNIKRCKFM